MKQRRETVHNRIQSEKFEYGKTVQTIKNFVKLFIIDQGAIDTISNDEWSRKIHAAIVRRNSQNVGKMRSRQDSGSGTIRVKPKTSSSLKRLDSYHLNQLTAKMFESPSKSSRLKRSDCHRASSPKFANTPFQRPKSKNLDKISEIEKDSFCTDSSMVSFCSDQVKSAGLKDGN